MTKNRCIVASFWNFFWEPLENHSVSWLVAGILLFLRFRRYKKCLRSLPEVQPVAHSDRRSEKLTGCVIGFGLVTWVEIAEGDPRSRDVLGSSLWKTQFPTTGFEHSETRHFHLSPSTFGFPGDRGSPEIRVFKVEDSCFWACFGTSFDSYAGTTVFHDWWWVYYCSPDSGDANRAPGLLLRCFQWRTVTREVTHTRSRPPTTLSTIVRKLLDMRPWSLWILKVEILPVLTIPIWAMLPTGKWIV